MLVLTVGDVGDAEVLPGGAVVLGGSHADFCAVNQRDAAAAALGIVHEPAPGFGIVSEDRIGGVIEDRVAKERTRGEFGERNRGRGGGGLGRLGLQR